LNELEGGAGSVALLLGEAIPLVEAALAVLKTVSRVSCLVCLRICTFFWAVMTPQPLSGLLVEYTRPRGEKSIFLGSRQKMFTARVWS